jgi:hypothetical protein
MSKGRGYGKQRDRFFTVSIGSARESKGCIGAPEISPYR